MPDRARWTPWIVSIALHAAIVVASLFVVWTILPTKAEPEQPVTLDFDRPAPAPNAPPPSTGERAVAQAPPLPDLPPPEPVALENASLNAADTPPPAFAAPSSPPSEASFITAGATDAREIIYVVDASGSAISAFPDIVARLQDSIAALHPSQRFQIILLRRTDGKPYDFLRVPPALQAPIPVDAIPENVAAAAEWLERIVPGGPSDLPAALSAATRTRARAVFVLARMTTADLPAPPADQLIATLDRLDPDRRTTIHTMQMFEPDPTGLLPALARARGGPGAHTLVTLDDLRETSRP
jgi:hypothetical protein